MIHLELTGVPIPWMRAKPLYSKRRMYDAQIKEKQQVRWQLLSQFHSNPITTPLEVNITFFMPIPKSISSVKRKAMIGGILHHMTKPDTDNMLKFYLDAMTGVIYVDDSQVWCESARKVYAERPGVLIKVIPSSLNQVIETGD